MKLNVLGLGLSLGILFGACLFLWTLVGTYTGYGTEVLALIASLYPGFEVSLTGAFIGLLYAFIDGLIGGSIIALLYNKLAKN